MLDRQHIFRASWTLVDQGVVSLGAFLVNVQLARHLVPEDYGVYALLFGAFLGLQLVNSSLLLYPMSIRLPVAAPTDRMPLLAATTLLVLAYSAPLCAVLAAGLAIFGHRDLIVPVLAAFVLWQLQEAMRRGLLAEFRHSSAIPGDMLSYLGLVAAVGALWLCEALTLPAVFGAMALACGAGAAVQAWQLRLSLRHVVDLRDTAAEFVGIGGWSLVNNVVSLLRVQSLPWALAAAGGAAAAASFQAALNVVNLANPIILGLCNVIPQTAAHAQRKGGNAEAWRAARVYMLIGAPPTLGYYAVAFAVPGFILSVFYGAASPYVSLVLAVQLLVVAWAIGYAADMVCSYLHGIDAARRALTINVLGAISAVVLALLLSRLYGLTGGCLALVGANLVRLAASHFIQTRITAHERTA